MQSDAQKCRFTAYATAMGFVLSIFLVLTGCGGGGSSSKGSGSGGSNGTQPAPAPANPPGVPTGLVAIPGNAQAQLSWNPVPDASWYTVYYNTTSPVTRATALRIDFSSENPVHAGRVNGRAYFYRVAASNAAGESALSAEVNVTPTAMAPGAPEGLRTTAADGQVTLTWEPVHGATAYHLFHGTVPGGPGTRVDNVASGHVHAGLANGTAYYYTVIAENAVGEGISSAEVSAVPAAAAGVPPAPTGLRAEAGDAETLLTWEPVPGAIQYNLYMREGMTVTPIPNVQIGHTHAGAVATVRSYTVRAQNAFGEGPASAQAFRLPSTALALGALTRGLANASEENFHTAAVTPGEAYVISLNRIGIDGGFAPNPDLWLYRDGTFTAPINCAPGHTRRASILAEDCTVVASGDTLHLGVQGSAVTGSTSRYTVWVSALSQAPAANEGTSSVPHPIALDTPHQGSVGSAPGATSYYIVNIPSTRLVNISLTGLQEGQDFDLRVYDDAFTTEADCGIEHSNPADDSPDECFPSPAQNIRHIAVINRTGGGAFTLLAEEN